MVDQLARVRGALERTRLISNWPDAAVRELCLHSELRTYQDGERVFTSREAVDAMWVITEGTFLLSKSWPNGRRFLYASLKPGQTAGALSVFDREPAKFDLIARGGGAAIVIGGAALRDIVRMHPGAAIEIIALLCRLERADYDIIELHAMNSVRCRIAKSLLWIARGEPSGREPIIDTKISQEELADIVCAARQSVNRELRRMMKEGVIKQGYRAIVILNRERLAEVACEDEDVLPDPHLRSGRGNGHLHSPAD